MTEDAIGRDELRQLLLDRIPVPDDATRQAMFDHTLGFDGPANDDLLPPAGLFDGRADADPDPEYDTVDLAEPHDTQDRVADDRRSWEIESDHGDHHVDTGPAGDDDHGDSGHPGGTHDAFHDGTPGSW